MHQLYNEFDMVKADISRFVGGRTYWPVALFLLGWLVLVGFRGNIQTQWWEMRLRRAPTAKQQEYYINLLSSAGSAALPVARSLLAEPDSVLRTRGIAILNGISGEPATSLLQSAIHDSEAEIRKAAVLGLAMRRDPRILPTIEKLVHASNQERALLGLEAYTSYGCEVASAPLCRMAREHDSALMRAHAIEQLGLMRCEEATPTLIEALTDDARYGSSTLLEEIDRQALNLLSEKRRADEAPIRLGNCRMVSEKAAFSLRLITRRSFEFHCGDRPEERQAAQTAWRNWWLGHREG